MTSSTDFKELIPEFYYNKDIYLNKNHLPLGELKQSTSLATSGSQSVKVINDVVLPPYAKDANHMVKIMRRALESDYVSTHLHDWIDLIFGYKQQGEEAEKAGNVFYYLTYDNRVDISIIDDQNLKNTIAQQITHYGQCPSPLFTTPHPTRESITYPLMKWYKNIKRCSLTCTEKIVYCVDSLRTSIRRDVHPSSP